MSDDRARLRMSDEEVVAFLGTWRAAVVGGRDPAGRMTARILPCRLDGGELVVDVSRAGGAFDLDGAPQMCAAADRITTYADLRAVVVRGTATVERDRSGRPVSVRLPLTDVVSFDFGRAPS